MVTVKQRDYKLMLSAAVFVIVLQAEMIRIGK